jgi:hypothetical protein
MPSIPWTAILTHGPAIVSAAKRLLATTDANKPDKRHQSIEARPTKLEEASMESARLLQEIAQQVQALTIAQQQTSRRATIALGMSAAAAVVSIWAGVLAVI